MTDTTPTAADHLLRLLLARMIAEGAHHAVASTRARTEELAWSNEGAVAAFELAAVHVADLIAEGRLRDTGCKVRPQTEVAVQRVLESLGDGPAARGKAITDAIYGGVATARAEDAVVGGDSPGTSCPQAPTSR